MRYSEKKNVLLEMLEPYHPDNYEVIVDKPVGTSRWSTNNLLLFRRDDDYFYVHYSTGATEYQDEYPFDHAGEDVEIFRCNAVDKVVKAFVDEKMMTTVYLKEEDHP